jgi:hypothetical protein
LGLDGLLDEPRPGNSRKLRDQQVEQVLTRTLESQPEAATHWPTRDMAKACGLSQSSISRIWRAFSLAPHRSETFKLSRDPLFIEKVRDIVGLYFAPPERALVLCVDEKSQIQALDRTAPLLPMRAGPIERRTMTMPATAPLRCLPRWTPRAADWPDATPSSLGRVSQIPRYHRTKCAAGAGGPPDPGQHGTHKTQLIRDWLVKRTRFHLHFTPTSASWLNLVERWFALLTEKQLRRGVHRSTKELETTIPA